MQTGDSIEYFKRYHISSRIFTDYLNENNWIFQTHGKDSGPSKNYINPDYLGKFGLIAPYSKDFCKSCNRLRITARGDLRLCLFGSTGIYIRHLIQRDDQLDELKDLNPILRGWSSSGWIKELVNKKSMEQMKLF